MWPVDIWSTAGLTRVCHLPHSLTAGDKLQLPQALHSGSNSKMGKKMLDQILYWLQWSRRLMLPKVSSHAPISLNLGIPITTKCRLLQQASVKEWVALELSKFQSGNMIGCHLCNKSTCEISSKLNIPQSIVSSNITKWKLLGTAATESWSGGVLKNHRVGSADAEARSAQTQ